MGWNMVGDLIAKYWVQQLCVLLMAGLTWVFNHKFKRYAQDQKAIRLAMIALLRDRFYQGYRFHMQNGFYPISDREVIRDIYDQYCALGGNGVVPHLMRELED